jgi:hypothetical protein
MAQTKVELPVKLTSDEDHLEHHQDIKKRIDEFFQRYLQTECEMLESKNKLEGEFQEENQPKISQMDQVLF